jgi:drug/metabolite transporter (DMT)-like permease
MNQKLPFKKLVPHILILTTTVIWAGAGTVIKSTLNHVPISTFLFLRFFVVCILLLPYSIILVKQYQVSKNDLLNMLLVGLFTHGSLIFIFLAYKFTSVIDTTVIGIIGSILTVNAGRYFYSEKINKKMLTGLILSSLGTLVVILEPLFIGQNIEQGTSKLLGNIFALGYNILYVTSIIWMKISLGKSSYRTGRFLYRIHLKPMEKEYPSEMITIIGFFVGLLFYTPLAIVENLYLSKTTGFSVLQIGFSGVMGILYMAILSSIVAYIFFQKSLDHLSVAEVGFYNYLSPVIAAPIAFVFLGEIPTTLAILGSIFIACGVILAEFSSSSNNN